MFSWLNSNKTDNQTPITVDIHSHVLPGIDDGAKQWQDSIELLRKFEALGYKKIITTPHIMSDAYRNTPGIIHEKLKGLNELLSREGLVIVVDAAAEYYLDEHTYQRVSAQEAMTFGDRYLLFETNFLTEPFNMKEFIFMAITKGYKLVLAHPERYLYMQNDRSKWEDLRHRGVLFQVNISSLTGYYSRQAAQTAEKLIDLGWVDFLGSDCHHMQHLKLLEDARKLKYFKKALSLPLLNNSLA